MDRLSWPPRGPRVLEPDVLSHSRSSFHGVPMSVQTEESWLQDMSGDKDAGEQLGPLAIAGRRGSGGSRCREGGPQLALVPSAAKTRTAPSARDSTSASLCPLLSVTMIWHLIVTMAKVRSGSQTPGHPASSRWLIPAPRETPARWSRRAPPSPTAEVTRVHCSQTSDR